MASPWWRSPCAFPVRQMADLVRHAVGVDLVEVALRQALPGDEVPDEIALPRFRQPLAIRFFTHSPGPCRPGRSCSAASLEPVLSAEGVVQADTYLQVGETIRPVRRDGDRRGYVIAVAWTPARHSPCETRPEGRVARWRQRTARSTSSTTARSSRRRRRAGIGSRRSRHRPSGRSLPSPRHRPLARCCRSDGRARG